MATLDQVIKSMQQSIDKPKNKSLANKASNILLDYIYEVQHSLIELDFLDNTCANTMELSKKYYDILDEYVSQSPTHQQEDGWIKVSGITFLVENIKQYAPQMFISESVRKKLERKILRKSGFRGDIKISSFGILMPIEEPALPSAAAILSIEEKTENPSNNPFNISIGLPGRGHAQLTLCMYIKLPWDKAGDIEDWEQFDQLEATEVEMTHINHKDIEINLPELSDHPARCISMNDLLFELGQSVVRLYNDTFDDEIITNLNNEERSDAKIEFVLSNLNKKPHEFLTPTNISIRLKDGSKLLTEFELLETHSPGFVLGHLNSLVNLMLRPGCKMTVVDLREQI